MWNSFPQTTPPVQERVLGRIPLRYLPKDVGQHYYGNKSAFTFLRDPSLGLRVLWRTSVGRERPSCAANMGGIMGPDDVLRVTSCCMEVMMKHL